MRNILQTARKNNPPTAQNSLRLPILLRFLVYSSSSSYYSFIICLTHGCICIACVSLSSSLYIFVVIERDERGPGLLFPYFLSSFSSSSSSYSFYILFSFHSPPLFSFFGIHPRFFFLNEIYCVGRQLPRQLPRRPTQVKCKKARTARTDQS